MRYGLKVNDTKTLFPLSINGVGLTHEGHVELVIGHSYTAAKMGDTIAGRVVLSTQETAALTEELAVLIDPDSRDQD